MHPDELTFDGLAYVSARRAAELTGYTRDYVGQLARGGKVRARRLDRVWFIERDSLLAHKEQADTFVPTPPTQEKESSTALEEVVSLDGKKYISAKRASEITGYNNDYVSQLARNAKIPSRQIAGRWFVSKEDIFIHKKEQDTQNAQIQARAMGLYRHQPQVVTPAQAPTGMYSQEEKPLFPNIKQKEDQKSLISQDYVNPRIGGDQNIADLRGVTSNQVQKNVIVYKRAVPALWTPRFGLVASVLVIGLFVAGGLFVGTRVNVGVSSMSASVVNSPALDMLSDIFPDTFLSDTLRYKR